MTEWLARRISTVMIWTKALRDDAALALLFWRSMRARAERNAIDRAAFVGATVLVVSANVKSPPQLNETGQ